MRTKGMYQEKHEISSTGDILTNDFDLEKDKLPALSTVKTQLRLARTLVNSGLICYKLVNLDRLKFSINLLKDGKRVGFVDLGLEELDNTVNPAYPPNYLDYMEAKSSQAAIEREIISSNAETEIQDDDFDSDFDFGFDFDFDTEEITNDTMPETNLGEDDKDALFNDTSIKRRVPYEIIKDYPGLNNIYIKNGYLVIDISGKFTARRGYLGGINNDNIEETLKDILRLKVIKFDVHKFLDVAQVFLCDLFIDILLNSETQVENYIQGISSFFPIVSNRFKICKYRRHGLQISPKSKILSILFSVYSKGEDLNYSYKRRTRATYYTEMIGPIGQELATRTLRFELKLRTLEAIRKVLNIEEKQPRYVALKDVLSSTEAVILKQVEAFANPVDLLKGIECLSDNMNSDSGLSLREVLLAERFVEILRENLFDIEIVRSHIRTEYGDVDSKELEYFNELANLRKNIITFLVYRKPKSVTVMLDVLRRLQEYYYPDLGGGNASE